MRAYMADIAGLPESSVSLHIGVTGHRSKHPVFSKNHKAIEQTIAELISLIGKVSEDSASNLGGTTAPKIRLHSLLAYGADLLVAQKARASGWSIVAPLPFGRKLNLAINAQPSEPADMRALIEGHRAQDSIVESRAAEIRNVEADAMLFEIAEQDSRIEALFAAHLAEPDEASAKAAFEAICSDRAAMAARVMIEQSDMVIGIWDGETRGQIGGTRHTIEAALSNRVPVIWIDARNPTGWTILRSAEMMAALPEESNVEGREQAVRALVREALLPSAAETGRPVRDVKWRKRSNRFFHAYRRIETIFGEPGNRPFRSLVQIYENPAEFPAGSGAPMLDAASQLPGIEPEFADRISSKIMTPFAWADAVSTWLSDAYRGSMVASFFLSAFAIIGGVAYLPFASVEAKWWFAAFELALLGAIIGIFFTGKRRRWHERWFEIRRTAEYLRHAPLLLLVGAARPIGRWTGGADGNWPEWYVRHACRHVGLPKMAISGSFLRDVLGLMQKQHVAPQMAYHKVKAARLKRAQHNLDRLSEGLFLLAVITVAIYLAIEITAAIGWISAESPHAVAKLFTFLGVLFPTLGGAFAGVHYFGDFERFAAISEMTADKMSDIEMRIQILLSAPDREITYARVSALAHAIDDIVVDEIENWQSVFAGKHITVPV